MFQNTQLSAGNMERQYAFPQMSPDITKSGIF